MSAAAGAVARPARTATGRRSATGAGRLAPGLLAVLIGSSPSAGASWDGLADLSCSSSSCRRRRDRRRLGRRTCRTLWRRRPTPSVEVLVGLVHRLRRPGILVGFVAGPLVGFASRSCRSRSPPTRSRSSPSRRSSTTGSGSTNQISKAMVAAVLCFFPVMINTVRGLTQVEPAVARADALAAPSSDSQVFRKVRMPERAAVHLHGAQGRDDPGDHRGDRRRVLRRPRTRASASTSSARRRSSTSSARGRRSRSPARSGSGCTCSSSSPSGWSCPGTRPCAKATSEPSGSLD